MAKTDLASALNDCIDRVANGQSIEDCLRTYPEQAQELRPMLEAGLLTRRARISPGEVAQAKDRVRFRLEEHRRERRAASPFRLARVSGNMAVVTLLVFVGLGLLAENSLPGDLLYGLKRITENARLLVGGNSLQVQFGQRRIDEVASLLAQKRAGDVTFDGQLQSISGSDWRVSGIAVTVASTTPGASTVRIGDEIEVQGSTTTQGELIARSITLIARASPTPTSTATITPSPQPSASPTDTSSPTPTPSQTATPTSTPSPQPTLTPTKTPLPPVLPTKTLVPTNNPPPAVTPIPPQPTDDHGGSGGGDNSGSGSGSSGSGSSDGGSGGGQDGSGHD